MSENDDTTLTSGCDSRPGTLLNTTNTSSLVEFCLELLDCYGLPIKESGVPLIKT